MGKNVVSPGNGSERNTDVFPNVDAPQNPGASFQTQAAEARESRECVNALRLSLHTSAVSLVLPSPTNRGMLGT